MMEHDAKSASTKVEKQRQAELAGLLMDHSSNEKSKQGPYILKLWPLVLASCRP